MKVIELISENIKTIKAVRIRPTGNVVNILGDNGAGKTSTLDSILYAFGGKGALPAEPVRRGAEVARISLDMGDIRIERVIRPDRTTVVKVIADNGAHYPTPETMLKTLFGEFAFDPFAFCTSPPKVQLETLRSLVKLDVDIDDLDRQNERDYEVRKGWNSKVESLKARAADYAAALRPNMDVTPVDLEALTQRMEEASERNLALTKQRHELAQLTDARNKLADNARLAREQAEALLLKAQELDGKAADLTTQLEATPAIPSNVDVTDLRIQVNDAMRANAERKLQAETRAAHVRATSELTDAQVASKSLTDAMAARLQQKKNAIGAAKMPVDGLGFGRDGVLYKDFPLEQASEAERYRVAFAIAIALNPKVRVVLIRNASLLDKKSLALVGEIAAEFDCQVWLERVGDGPCGILIEDGEVAAIDGVPVEAGVAAD